MSIELQLKTDLANLSNRHCEGTGIGACDEVCFFFCEPSTEKYVICLERYADWEIFCDGKLLADSRLTFSEINKAIVKMKGKILKSIEFLVEASEVRMIFDAGIEINMRDSFSPNFSSMPNADAIWSYWVPEAAYYLMPHAEIAYSKDNELSKATYQLNGFKLNVLHGNSR